MVAYPGGRIIVDGRVVGQDSTGVLTLTPGAHQVRVENAYAGDTTTTITLTEGQTGVVTIEW
ncbi:MAG: PEGA domain-containing protein [Polyangiales bacterium]